MTDYLIIGSGLAGISFSETALNHDKSVLVFNNDSQHSSKIAAGLYNPVILKRFTALQNAQYQIEILKTFYSGIEDKLKVKLNYPMPILRKFFCVEEQNNWFAASDKIGLMPFLSQTLTNNKYPGIDAPFGYGEVLNTGYIDTAKLLEHYEKYLLKHGAYQAETFEYEIIEFKEHFIQYKNIQAKNIVFAEGFGLHANPFFNYLPLDGTKGELFIIKAPDLNLDAIVNTSVFILPLGNNLFKVGATYNWIDKTRFPTEEGKQELTSRIKDVLNCEFEIIEHLASIRPTVKDRKPLIGTHHVHKNLHILNGLGTRGVMLGPSMAKNLFENIEYGIPIDRENDIRRFYKKLGIMS